VWQDAGRQYKIIKIIYMPNISEADKSSNISR